MSAQPKSAAVGQDRANFTTRQEGAIIDQRPWNARTTSQAPPPVAAGWQNHSAYHLGDQLPSASTSTLKMANKLVDLFFFLQRACFLQRHTTPRETSYTRQRRSPHDHVQQQVLLRLKGQGHTSALRTFSEHPNAAPRPRQLPLWQRG